MGEAETRALVEAYQQALETRDPVHCTNFYTEDAIIHFGTGEYQGRDALEEWHQDRFDASLRLVEMREVSVKDSEAVYDVVVASNALKRWKINALRATAVFHFDGDRIREVKFTPRLTSLFEAW
jgi:ketosteroid isomerase-like protein